MPIHRQGSPLLVFVAVTLVVTGVYFSASARIGETHDQLGSTESRYGEAVAETSAVLVDSRDTVDVFMKDRIRVEVEYAKDGKVWRITYRKKDFGESMIKGLLERNGGEREWSKPEVFKDDKHWTTTDKQMHAVYYGNPVYKLVIMTRPALLAKRRPHELVREVKKVGEEAETIKKPDDPLEGF